MKKKKNKGKTQSTTRPVVRSTTKKIEPICNNCLCYDREKGICKVVIFINEKRFNLPVFPGDRCHMDELGIEVEQVRWWVEDEDGNPTSGKGRVKIQYPEKGFFPDVVDPEDLHGRAGGFEASPEKPPLPPALPPEA